MPQLSLADRSFQYGDGLFTTIKVSQRQLQLWPLHWDRLQAGMQRLGFAPLSEQQVLAEALAAITQPEQVLKIVVSRGNGGRGYSPSGCGGSQIYINTSPLPDYALYQQAGVSLGLATIRLAIQPMLAGIKHCSRLETVLHKIETEQSSFQELLACDSNNMLTECASANVFFLKQGQWFTPDLNNAGVAGVMRRLVLDNMPVTMVQWQAAALNQIDAMFICNALMGIVPVRQWQQRALAIGEVQQLQSMLKHWLVR